MMMTVCSASTKYDSRARMKNPRCFRLRKSFSSATSEAYAAPSRFIAGKSPPGSHFPQQSEWSPQTWRKNVVTNRACRCIGSVSPAAKHAAAAW